MKIKCKVSKQLKRALKHKAAANDMARTDYVLQSLKSHIEASGITTEGVEAYKVFLIEREQKLEALKLALEDESLDPKDRSQQMKDFYKSHHMYRPINSKNRQLENIILNVSDHDFHVLMMLADQSEQTIENYVEKILHFFK